MNEIMNKNAINGKTSSDQNNKVSIQIQTSATPSPVSSVHSNGSLVDTEATTQNTLISSKEKTIWSPEEQQLVNEIQEFAKTFKLCRLSLGLTQSQVGQELSALGPCYSQSAICRFEKLDITLKSAKKIKPVLENWMREAEEKYRNNKVVGNVKPEALVNGLATNKDNNVVVVGSSSSSFKISSALELVNKNNNHTNVQQRNGLSGGVGVGSSGGETISSNVNIYKVFMETNKKRKRRTSFTPSAIDALNKFFEENNHPNGAEMTRISELLNYDRDVVRVWFCNKRQATKAKNKNDNVTYNNINNNNTVTESSKSSNNNQKTIDSSNVNNINNAKSNNNSDLNKSTITASSSEQKSSNLPFIKKTSSITSNGTILTNSLPFVNTTSTISTSSTYTSPQSLNTTLPIGHHQFFNPIHSSHAQAIKTIPIGENNSNQVHSIPPVATMVPLNVTTTTTTTRVPQK